MPKICEHENCRKYANYGEFFGKPLRCKEHKETYKLVSQICIHSGCKVQPSYNVEGGTKALYCAIHKLDGMIDIKSKNCLYPGCKVQPVYNMEEKSTGIYCATHKLDGMVNIKCRTCIYPHCKVQPSCNIEGETKALYCTTHKLEGMVNIVTKTCIHSGCKIIPNYNIEGKTKPLYCATHKLDGMVNIKDKTCIHPGCKVLPAYNLEGKNKMLYCATHKLDGMVNIKCKTCIHPDCKVIPNYNIEGETKAIYCISHKLYGMIDVRHNKCRGNLCFGTRANPKYKGYCVFCYQQLFPNDPLTLQIRSKTKEIAIRDFINIHFEGFHHDIPLWTGNCECIHRRRIDHRKLIGNTLLCIETDENQHKGYDKDDEEIRYDDLYMLHGGKFIFIRFNPDKFKNKGGKSINPMLYTRLATLKEEIEKQISRIENEENKELLEIIKLYYDE
jgi:hypothetical protein